MKNIKTKIDLLLNAKTIAVVGASHNKAKIGHQILFNLMRDGFRGQIFPVNPEGGKILGLKVYQDIRSIGRDIDLVIIVIPRDLVWPVVAECADEKVGAITIISSGFAESGHDGQVLQEKIKSLCDQAGMTLLGPNCLGLLSTPNCLNASFARSMPERGKVALVSQSGAIITALIDWSKSHGVGFSHILSLGNKAGVSEAEALQFLYDDPETETVVLYLENLVVTENLITTLKRGVTRKPTIAFVGGSSATGSKSALSHTGSVVSPYLSVKTFLEQSGVVVLDSYSDLYASLKIFAHSSRKIVNSFAVITNAGGPAIAICDAMAKTDLKLSAWGQGVTTKMQNYIWEKAVCHNPIDLIGDATSLEYKRALFMVETETDASGVFLIVTPQTSTDIENIAALVAGYRGRLTIFPVFLGGAEMFQGNRILEQAKKPVFNTPDEAVSAAFSLIRFSEAVPDVEYQRPREKFFAKSDIIKTFAEYGLPYLPYYLVNTEDEARSRAKVLGYPVVLKTADPKINHKSESKAVRLNILSETELLKNLKELGGKAIIGKMIVSKADIFLGIKKDKNIGNVVLFGTGGIYAELYQDFSRRVAPTSSAEIRKMILETKMGRVLSGYRGAINADIGQLVKIVKSAEKFVNDHSNISEVDFNPVMFDGRKYYIVDARIIEDIQEGGQ